MTANQTLAVDITDYPTLKSRGAGIAKIGDAFVLAQPVYDRAGTKHIETAAFDRTHIAALRAELERKAAALDAVEADMNAAESKA